ncbi:co-chaperone DjlA [Hydrocarboniphaga sp.]|uniref:co-chaperone DjlA n=1 Tax=Hydrocarboniphaga sp. TaxID=2033016 RepID=UPI003D0F1A58
MNFLIWIGAFVGLASGGWKGLLIGAAVGYIISRYLPPLLIGAAAGKLGQIQAQFLDSTFAVMGAMCKADGQVTRNEIEVAEALFERLRLSADTRESAIASFNRGKADGFDVDAEVAKFAQASRGQRVLHQMFIQVQMSALAADGAMHPAEHALLVRIARGLGLSEQEFANLEAMLRGGTSSSGGSSSYNDPSALEAAYRVIGVPATASDAELKRAYRVLMSQNHPDKLAAKGLPESMRAMAVEKTQQITTAYDRIEKARRTAAA